MSCTSEFRRGSPHVITIDTWCYSRRTGSNKILSQLSWLTWFYSLIVDRHRKSKEVSGQWLGKRLMALGKRWVPFTDWKYISVKLDLPNEQLFLVSPKYCMSSSGLRRAPSNKPLVTKGGWALGMLRVRYSYLTQSTEQWKGWGHVLQAEGLWSNSWHL